MVKPFEIQESVAAKEGRYQQWYSAPLQSAGNIAYQPQIASEELAPEAMQQVLQDDKKLQEGNWLSRKLNAIKETGLGLTHGFLLSGVSAVNSVQNAADWLLSTQSNPNDQTYQTGKALVEQYVPDLQSAEENAPVASFVTRELMPMIAGGYVADVGTKALLSRAIGQFKHGYEGSTFWTALNGGAKVSNAATQGIIEEAGKHIVGAVTREVAGAVGSNVALAPMMYLEKMDGDDEYVMNYGALMGGTAMDSAIAAVMGGFPAAWKVRSLERAFNAKRARPVIEAVDEVLPYSLAQQVQEGTAAINLRTSAKTNQAIQHYWEVSGRLPNTTKSRHAGAISETAFNQMHKAMEELFGKKLTRPDVEQLAKMWQEEQLIGQDSIRPLMKTKKPKGLEADPNKFTLPSGAQIRFKFGDEIATEDYYQKSAIMLKNELTARQSKSFVTSKDGGNFNGTMSKESLKLLQAIGNTESNPSKIESFLVGYKNRFMRDPLRRAAATIGEQTTAKLNKCRDLLLQKQGWVREFIARPLAEIETELNKFWDVYSAKRNNAWDIKAPVRMENGQYAIPLAETEHNTEQWARLLQKQGLEQEGIYRSLDWYLQAIADEVYSVPMYMPSLQNINQPATMLEGSDHMRLWDDLMGIENEIAEGMAQAKRIDKNVPNWGMFHTQVPQLAGDEIWSAVYGLADASVPANMRPYYSFATEKDARKFANKFGESWQVVGGKARLESIGIPNGTDIDRLLGTRGHGLGHWQGDMADQGVNGIVEILEGQARGMHKAVTHNVQAENLRILELIEQTNGRDVAEEISKVITGNANLYRVNDTLDTFLRALGRNADDFLKWKHRLGVEPTDARVLPRELPFQTRKAVSTITKNLGQFYYGVANLTGAVVNCLSVLQAIPLSTAWFNKSATETAEEYLTRTTIRDGKYRGMLDTFRLGANFMKRAATEKGFWKTLYASAGEAGMIGGDYRAVQDALDASKYTTGKVSNWFEKTKDTLALPVTKSEEFSRVVTYGMGRQYAEDFLHLEGQAVQDFARLFTEIGMGGFTPLAKMGWAQSTLGSHIALFSTYASNMLFRSLDLIADNNMRRFVTGQILCSTLFGLDTNPVNSMWLSGHDLMDDVKLNKMFDMGLSSVAGVSISDRLDASPSDLTDNFKTLPMVSFAGSTYDMLADIAKDIVLSREVSGRQLAEALSIHSPILLVRRLAQTGLGYSIDRNHQLVIDARNDLLKRVGLLTGVNSVQDALAKNVKRIIYETEAAQDEARKTFRSGMLARARGNSDGSLDNIITEARKLYGHDPNAMLAAILGLLENADMDAGTQLLLRLTESPTPENMVFLEVLLNNMTDSTLASKEQAQSPVVH